MRRLIATLCATLVWLLSQPSIAQDEGPAAPIEKAPYHLPVFKNQYVTMLKINLPPQRNTGFHVHSTDSVSVNIEEAEMANQLPGEKPTPRVPSAGRPNFTAHSKQGPRTHKASNMGETAFHNVSFLFNYAQPTRFSPSSRSGVFGYTEVMDNERVRGWRLVLDPGQTAAPFTQTAPGLRIVLDGGEIAEIVAGQPDRGMNLRLGEFYWQEPGMTRAIRNVEAPESSSSSSN